MSPILLLVLVGFFSRVLSWLPSFTPCSSCLDFFLRLCFCVPSALLSCLFPETFLASYRGSLGLWSRPDSSPTPAIMGSKLDFLLFGNCSIEAPTSEELDKISQYLPLLKAFHKSLKTRMRSYFSIAPLLNSQLTYIQG